MDRPSESRPRARLRFAVYAALLFASWNHNALGLPDAYAWARTEFRGGSLGLEADLVVTRIDAAGPAISPWHPLFKRNAEGVAEPYRSQFGLPGVVIGAVKPFWPFTQEALIRTAAALLGLFTASIVAAVFAVGARSLSPAAADIACGLAAFCPVFLPFAPSLYWSLGLMLLPFGLTWGFYPVATTPARRVLLIAAVGLAVTAKSLCGYEYITTVILAPLAAAWFHQQRLGESLTRRFGTAIAIGLAGVAGFALAIGLHAVQLHAVFGENGLAVIRERAVARTVVDPGTEPVDSRDPAASRLRYVATCFLAYFKQRVLSTPRLFGPQRDVSLAVIVALTAAIMVTILMLRHQLSPAIVGLGGACVIGLLAGISWQVLASNHMCVHRHLNLIVFAVPFLPLAFLTIGTALTALPASRKWGPAFLGGVILLAVAGAIVSEKKALATEAARPQYEAWVMDAVRQTSPARSPRLVGSLDAIERAGDLHRFRLIALDRLDLNTDAPADPGEFLLNGWALDIHDPRHSTQPHLVVLAGGKPVPSRVLWFRRSDLDRLLPGPLPEAGFTVLVASTDVPAGERPRLFAVSPDGSRVTELVTAPAPTPREPLRNSHE